MFVCVSRDGFFSLALGQTDLQNRNKKENSWRLSEMEIERNCPL
jgi:hypothetical protein